ncbi:MAG: hypothetical protein RLO01_12675 [Thalassobaculaceae bacterium]
MADKTDTAAPEKTDAATAAADSKAGTKADTKAGAKAGAKAPVGKDGLPTAAQVARALKAKIRDVRKEGKTLVPVERAAKAEDILAIAERDGVIRCTTIDGRKHEVTL